MLNYVLKPLRHQSFYKKYASKKFLKVSQCQTCVSRMNLPMRFTGERVRARLGASDVGGKHPSIIADAVAFFEARHPRAARD